ncbi:MAG: CHASE domain-containing protein [Betaproteobacteria bacterium]
MGHRIKTLIGPALVFAIGIALSAALFVYVRDDIERDATLRFERQAADAKHIIERRLHSYVGVTYGLKALFAARDSVSRAEFHQYVASLNLPDNYPGFIQLNYAHHIQSGERQTLEEEVRRDFSLDPRGYPDFAIKPRGERAEHHVLIYIEPMDGNRFSFGIDIIASAPQAKVVGVHRDTGQLFSSGRLLNAGKDGSVGLAMRLAVYRNGAAVDTPEQRRAAFIGTVGAGYNVRKLMAGVLDDTTMTSMRYRLYDAGSVGEVAGGRPTLLYDSAQTAPGAPRDDFLAVGAGPWFDTVLPLELASRRWELHFSAPVQAFLERTDYALPWIVVGAGLLSSVLLFAVVLGFATQRARALALAEEITRELRESEASLAHAQSLARLGSWTLDLDSGAMVWSTETHRLLGLEAMPGPQRLQSLLAWLAEEDRSAFRAMLERCAAAGVPAEFECAFTRAAGEALWMHFVLQPVGEAGRRRIRGTIMDVTERKRALEAQRAHAAQTRDLLRRLVSAQEDERRRYSANLHDLVGQSLTVVGIGLETVRGTLRTPGEAAERALAQMGNVLRDTMSAVRQVMSDLRPPLLDDYGVYAALEWHARQLEARTGVRIELQGGKFDPRPAAEVEMALFRIAQEALTNVVKHAGASGARIALTRHEGRLRLIVEDDGRGMAATTAANDPARPAWGMAVMRERAMAVGGEMRVEVLERGTRIVVEVAA